MKSFAKKFLLVIPVIVLTVILTAGLFISVSDLPSHSICVYKHIFRFDCPGCGLTRAFLLIPKGEFLPAIQLNAASPILYILFILMLVTLFGKKFYFNFMNRPLFKKTSLSLGVFVVFVAFGHWFYKIYLYFSLHSFSDYLANLMKNPFFWLFWS